MLVTRCDLALELDWLALRILFIKAEFKYKRCAKKYRYKWLHSPYQRVTDVTNFSFYCITQKDVIVCLILMVTVLVVINVKCKVAEFFYAARRKPRGWVSIATLCDRKHKVKQQSGIEKGKTF